MFICGWSPMLFRCNRDLTEMLRSSRRTDESDLEHSPAATTPAHSGTYGRPGRSHQITVVAGDGRFGRMRDAPHLDVSQTVTSKCPSR